jgi:hypothetical protein
MLVLPIESCNRVSWAVQMSYRVLISTLPQETFHCVDWFRMLRDIVKRANPSHQDCSRLPGRDMRTGGRSRPHCADLCGWEEESFQGGFTRWENRDVVI